MALAWISVEDKGIARTYVASSTHRQVIALGRAGLMVLRKGEVVPLQVLASYMTALAYFGEGRETAAAWGRARKKPRTASFREVPWVAVHCIGGSR